VIAGRPVRDWLGGSMDRHGQAAATPCPNFSTQSRAHDTLANGRHLKPLHAARTALLDVFGSVNVRSGDHATRRLLAAAESGKSDDIAAVTDAIERVLRDRQLL
jgi:hypothetical protein